MPGPDLLPLLAFPVPFVHAPGGPAGVLAYGPAPGVELIPYFLGLLAWAGLAVLALLLSPFSALLRRLRKARGTPPGGPPPSPPSSPRKPSKEQGGSVEGERILGDAALRARDPLGAPVSESPGEGSHDRA